MGSETLRGMIEARQGNKSYPALDWAQRYPGTAAVLSKLVTPVYPRTHDTSGNRTIDTPDRSNFAALSSEVAQREQDTEQIMTMFPEMELVSQIMISSVIAPKDMSTTEMSISLADDLVVDPLAAQINQLLEDYFTKDYKIEPLLPTVLHQALFGPGCRPMVVIPENSIDELINGPSSVTMESLGEFVSPDNVMRHIGILGDPAGARVEQHVSMEDLVGMGEDGYTQTNKNTYQHKPMVALEGSDNPKIFDKFISITDNPDALKMPKLFERQRKLASARKLNSYNPAFSYAMESAIERDRKAAKDANHTFNDYELTSLLYKNKTGSFKHIQKVKTDDELARGTIGAPLVFAVPAQALIPIFTPGNEREHAGYFMLIDGEGNPLSKHSNRTDAQNLRGMMGLGNKGNDDMASSLLNRASSMMGNQCKDLTFDQAARVYGDIIEADLLARLRNGLNGPNVSIARNTEVYRIMLARSLAKQNTQLLYIPKELVTYFAYKYNDQGFGKSLLDDMRILNSLRAMLMFSTVMSQVKNSVGRTRVSIKLSADDPNPQKTIEIATHEVMKARQATFPLGLYSPAGLADWCQTAGVEFEFDGHPGLPDTKLEFSETSTNYAKPDTELEENLRKRTIMSAGLSPETVDNAFSAEFATTAIANNMLLAKRVKQIQEAFTPQFTEHARQVARNDGDFVSRLRKLLKENLKVITDVENKPDIVTAYEANENVLVELLVMEVLGNFHINLAEPDTVTLTNQMEAYEKQAQAYDTGLDSFINEYILPPALAGEKVGERANEYKAIIKAKLMRDWMAKNNVLPELTELITLVDGKPVFDLKEEHKDYINALTKSVVGLLQDTVPVGQAADRDVDQISGGQELGASTAPAADSGGGGDFSSGGGDFDTGLDFGSDMSLDAGLPEAPENLDSIEPEGGQPEGGGDPAAA